MTSTTVSFGIERGRLEADADPRLERRGVLADIDAEHGGRPAVRDAQALEDLDRRRLAGAVRPEQAEHLAGGDVEVDPVDGEDLAVALDQAANVDDRRRGDRPRGLHGAMVTRTPGAPAHPADRRSRLVVERVEAGRPVDVERDRAVGRGRPRAPGRQGRGRPPSRPRARRRGRPPRTAAISSRGRRSRPGAGRGAARSWARGSRGSAGGRRGASGRPPARWRRASRAAARARPGTRAGR